MPDTYKILKSNNILVPKEICYLNFKHFFMEYHQHPPGSIELNYIVEGECIYDINGEIFTLPRRSLILVNGSVPHRMLISSGCINMSINCYQETKPLCFGTLKNLAQAYPALNLIFQNLSTGLVLHNARLLYPLLKSICDVYDNPKEESPLRQTGLQFAGEGEEENRDFYYLNLLVNKALIDISKLHTSARPSPRGIYVSQVKDYISYHFFDIKNIDDMADHIALNKIYLQKIFKKETGMTLWSYLTKFRMQKATYYLSHTKIPIGDIDEIIGINSRQNFYLLFKKEYGISPYEYRQKYKVY